MKVRESATGRPVPDENLHITLAFLGSIDEQAFDCVRTAARGLQAEPFDLVVDRAGWWRRTGILWLAPSRAPAALNRLVKSLWAALEPCGFWPDYRDFHPHLTIARVRTARQKDRLASFVKEMSSIEFGVTLALAVELKQSTLTPKGPIYTTLTKVELV